MSRAGPAARIDQARRLMETGRAAEAATLLQRALQQSPRDVGVCNALALVLMGLGQHEQAAFYAQRALSISPGNPLVLTNLGNALGMAGRDEDAARAFQQALAAEPRMVEAHLGLANLCRHGRRYAQAARHAQDALGLHPEDPYLIALTAALQMHLVRTAETVRITREALERYPDPELAVLHAHALNYQPGVAPRDVRAAHEAYARLLMERTPAPPPFPNSRDPDRRVRLGLLSADLRRHSVAFFLEAWMERHDRRQFELFCYSTSVQEDPVKTRLRAHAAAWRDAAGLDAPALAAAIRADRVDILIETSGLTQGHRMPVLAMKPAPVQVTMIGYPATTGFPTIDYRIVDSLTDPPGAEAHCVEELVRLDPCFLCYSPPAEAPEPRMPAEGGPITFGSFNQAGKLSPELLELWARVLRACPGSRLLLKALDFDEPSVRDDVRSRLAGAGIEPARVEVLASVAGLREHLELYSRVDIALDTFPYHGTTTTLEAMWMGVPVVTLAGEAHVSRVGLSLLHNTGLPELVASTPDGYVRIASDLAADRARRAALRSSLRAALRASPICDGPGYARRLDAALGRMWRRWCGAGA